MVLNDPRMPTHFQMGNTWNIRLTETRAHMLSVIGQTANTKGRLKNLVFNCHGNAAYLQLGQGFSFGDVAAFSSLSGLVEKIWITACLIARIPAGSGASGGGDGNQFCSLLARSAGCYVVASTEIQCHQVKTFPLDCIDSYEGLVVCYNRAGAISWSTRNQSTHLLPDGSCTTVPD
jgi:hypothetical protein